MARKKLFIERRHRGDFAIRKPSAERASEVTRTQKQAIERARAMTPTAEILVERVRKTDKGNRDKWRKP